MVDNGAATAYMKPSLMKLLSLRVIDAEDIQAALGNSENCIVTEPVEITFNGRTFMQNFIVAAESVGLGTCPISMIRNRIDEFAEILNLPDGVFPIAGLTLGWPDWGGMLSVRLPQSIVVHFETYDDDALNAEIDPHDDRAHERKPIKPGSQRHTDRYGVLEKCTWSENATRQLSEPERSQFAAFLKSKGIELK